MLNGAAKKHQWQPPYRKSRGWVVLNFFEYKNFDDFAQNYDFKGLEPFTLVVIEQGDIVQLNEIRWDGQWLHHKLLDADMSYAWSSVTLYSNEVVQERERWFYEWQQQHPLFEGNDVLDFHSFGGKEDAENGLIINRNNELRTVSVTQVQKTTEQFLINYWDQMNDQQYRYRIFDTDKVLH